MKHRRTIGKPLSLTHPIAIAPCIGPRASAALRPRIDDPHHPFEIGFGHGRAGRQAETVAEERLGHRAADALRSPRRPAAGASASTPGGPRCSRASSARRIVLAVGAELGRVDRDDGQPAGGAAPGRFGHEGDAGQVAQALPVEVEDCAACAATRSSSTCSWPRPMAASTLLRR